MTRYRYKQIRYNALVLTPSPDYGPEAIRFVAQTKQIAREIWGEGAALNQVVTEVAGPLLFQGNIEICKRRARRVAKIWREKQRKITQVKKEIK